MVNDLILWWENELSCDDRHKLFKAINYETWEGTREERHKKLAEMYKVWKKEH